MSILPTTCPFYGRHVVLTHVHFTKRTGRHCTGTIQISSKRHGSILAMTRPSVRRQVHSTDDTSVLSATGRTCTRALHGTHGHFIKDVSVQNPARTRTATGACPLYGRHVHFREPTPAARTEAECYRRGERRGRVSGARWGLE